MSQRYLTPTQLASRPGRPGRWPFSLATLWRQIKTGDLPEPVALGAHTRGFPVHEIEAIEAAINAGAGPEDRRVLVQRLLVARRERAAAAVSG